MRGPDRVIDVFAHDGLPDDTWVWLRGDRAIGVTTYRRYELHGKFGLHPAAPAGTTGVVIPPAIYSRLRDVTGSMGLFRFR